MSEIKRFEIYANVIIKEKDKFLTVMKFTIDEIVPLGASPTTLLNAAICHKIQSLEKIHREELQEISENQDVKEN